MLGRAGHGREEIHDAAWLGKARKPGPTAEILAEIGLMDPYETGRRVILLGRFGSGGRAGNSRNWA
jgi:hypothetical protein